MADEQPVRRRIEARGRVQGVFFRESTRRWATQRGVAGWVRNRPDGSVEAVFEGERDAVLSLVESCRLGPPDARVERLDVHEEAAEGLTGFRVW
jgi:acylphosphatase